MNAVFEDSTLFSDIFKGVKQKGVRYAISNSASGKVLYTYNAHGAGIEQQPRLVDTIQVAGQGWRLALSTTPNFGVHDVDKLLPPSILVGGTLVALLAAALTAAQIHKRDQAVRLAISMTEDLNNERDVAVVNRQKDEAILSSIGDAVFAVDVTGKIILYNRAASILTGISEDKALGQPYSKLLHFRQEKGQSPRNSFIASALAGKQAKMSQGTVLERQDGIVIPVADSAAPIVGTEGKVEGAVIVFRDITREKELEHMKDEFVSIASHELRTPMGAIRANVSMILEGDYGPVNKGLVEPLTDIHTSTVRLVDMVGDLLSVARIEAGRMKFTLVEVNIADTIKHVVASLVPLGNEKGVAIQSFTLKKKLLAQADDEKVQQVLTNLIGNSLKFTTKGSITVRAAQTGKAIEVDVIDTGLGISFADQKKLFSKFTQINSAQAGKPQGTGLGLYISREIVRKMGGDLWIKRSAPEEGSTFAFTIPVSGTPAAAKVKKAIDREAHLHPDQR